MRRGSLLALLAVLCGAATWWALSGTERAPSASGGAEHAATDESPDVRPEPVDAPSRRRVAGPENDVAAVPERAGPAPRCVLVVDEWGAPIEGADVADGPRPEPACADPVLTAADGTAELVLSDSGELSVRAAGFAAGWREYGDAVDDPDPLRVVLREGRRIAGVVVDTRGAPVPGVLVWIAIVSRHDGSLRRLCQTGGEGRFEFVDLDSAPGAGRVVSAALEGHTCEGVFVHPGELDVRLVMHRSCTIQGVVTYDDGAPVSEAKVVGVEDGAATDPQGRFTLSPEVSGTIRLRARHVSARSAGVPFVGSVEVDVPEGESVSDVRIVLRPDPERSQLRVRVLDPSGAPVPDATVLAWTTSHGRPREVEGRTDKQGVAAFGLECPPGTPALVAAGRAKRAPELDARYDGAVPTLDAGSTDEVVLTLGDPGRLRLRLVDDRGDAVPLDDVRVEQLLHASVSNPDGTFVLGAIDQFVATIQVPGFAPRQVLLDPPHPPLREETVVLHRSEPCVVRGRVVGPDGSALPDDTVVVIESRPDRATEDEPSVADSTTLDDGAFELDGHFRGAARIRVLEPEGFTLAREVELRIDGDTDVGEVVVPRAARWSGVVTDAEGRPLSGAAVRVTAASGQDVPATTTRADGTFDLLVAPGLRVDLDVSRRGFADRSESVVTGGDDPVRVVLLRE